jgi:hypothetical protein
MMLLASDIGSILEPLRSTKLVRTSTFTNCCLTDYSKRAIWAASLVSGMSCRTQYSPILARN